VKAVFRCDATADIGFGHLSRCIALAEAFRLSGVGSVFAGLFDPAAQDQIGISGFDRADFADPVNAAAAERQQLSDAMADDASSFVIVDSYRVDESYLCGLRALGSAVVVIDDFKPLESYPCDVVLNFTWEAGSLGYPEGPVLLLGPAYFPARRQLVENRPQSIARQRPGPVRNLLIAIGGADPKRIAARLVRILRDAHAGLCLHVIAANEGDLPDTLAGFAAGSIVLPRQPDLSEQLLWADACVTGGGLIKYESAFMGVPAAAVSQNEGQAAETRALAGAGLVFDLGLADDCSDEELGGALDRFLADTDLRNGLAKRGRQTFPSDPSAHAAGAIVEAIGS
jgi:spore coat polysaccharide biosynthesis predicted glycosyltransferase SpsG